MDSRDMHSRACPPNPPWNEVLRACASGDLHQCAFGMRLRLRTDRLEPRTVGLVLTSGQRSADLEPVYVCPCGGFALGGRDAVTIDDVSTVTGATKFVDVVVATMRQLRSELTGATEPHLRTIATELHAGLLRQLCIHATRWNLPPYALLGRTRARPAECRHRA